MGIQLSISLLASDRPAALGRCLDSLRPLMMQVPSELIVVTTGTDKRVREAAARYTDRIIPFTWCGDFAAARNAGLREAHGEWFLYIDDDEWFEDTTEIRDFFLSGEYRKFGTAVYVQRNYVDWQGLVYSDFPAPRLVKLFPESRFINPIHEEVVPRYTPCRYLGAYVHHYGYVRGGHNGAAERTSRNLPMLLEDIRKRPSYTKNYAQIVQEYRQAGDWEKAEEYCRKGLKSSRKTELLPFHRWLQSDLIEILYAKGDYEKAEAEILTILQKYRPCEMVRLTAYLILNRIYIRLGKPEEALDYGMQYEKTLAYMDQNPHLWHQQECGHFSEAKMKRPNTLYKMRINCVEQALSCGDREQAAFFLSKLPWDEEGKIQDFYHIFDYLKEAYPGPFHDILEEFPDGSPYLLLQRAMDRDNAGKERRQELLGQCVEKAQLYSLRRQAVEEAVLCGMDIAGIADAFGLDAWGRCCTEIVNGVPDSDLPKAWDAWAALRPKAHLHALLLEKALRERQLARGYLTGREFLSALSEYTECVLSYYKRLYCAEMFQDGMCHFLPEDCRFGLFLSKALQKIEFMEFPEAVRLLRMALPLNTKMTGVVHELIRLLTDMLQDPSFSAGEEFQALAAQMKGSLAAMLQNKQYSLAVPVMQQLCTLVPGDLELLRLRQKLLTEMEA